MGYVKKGENRARVWKVDQTGVNAGGFYQDKLFYVGIFVILSVFLVLFGSFDWTFDLFPAFSGLSAQDAFLEMTARITAVLMTFHLFLFLITLSPGQCVTGFHETWYLTKFIILSAMICFTWFLDFSFMEFGNHLPLVMVFLLGIMGIQFLNIGYEVNSSLVEDDHLKTLLAQSAIFTAVAGVMIYDGFVGATNPASYLIMILAASGAGVAYFIVILRALLDRASLLVSSMVACYISYLAWIAIRHFPSADQTPGPDDFQYIWDFVMGCGIMTIIFVSICGQKTHIPDSKKPLLDSEDASANEEDQKDFEEYQSTIPKFHFFMVCAAVFMAMLVTNWNSNDAENTTLAKEWSIWFLLPDMIVVFALFIFSVVAPLIFKDRDFD